MLDKLSHYYLTHHSHEAALAMGQMSHEDIKLLLDDLDYKTRGIILAELMREETLNYLNSIEAAESIKIFKATPLRATIRIFIGLPNDMRKTLLNATPHALRLKIESAVIYGEDCVGSQINVNVLSLPQTLTIKLARQIVKDNPDELLHILYIVDEEHKLIGFVDTKTLLTADESVRLSQLVNKNIIFLPATAKLARVHLHPAWRRLNHLPVVNKNLQLLGVLSHKTLIPSMLKKESTTQYFTQAFVSVLKTFEDVLATLLVIFFKTENKR